MNNNKRQHRDHAGESTRRGRRPSVTVAIYLALTAVTLAVFGQTVRHTFVNFDDDLYVYNSPFIKMGLTIKATLIAFTTPHARNWHPLTTISHILDYQLWGLNAGGHHATNVILHTIAVLLLFTVLHQMTGALWKSALVAALFAVHPLHVESVAWVSERKDVLSAVFFFLMLAAYVRYARGPSVARYLLVAVLFAAGLMSKPMLVSAPIVLLLMDYWPLHRIRSWSSEANLPTVVYAKSGGRKSVVRTRWSAVRNIVFEKVPLFILSAASCFITFTVQKRATGAIPPLPWLCRAENAVASYVVYIWQTLWPAGLTVFYPHPNNTLPMWEIGFVLVFLTGTTLAAIFFRRQCPYLFTGWFWYVVMLVPVIGLVQVGEQGHADRYTYLPHIGLFLLAVWGIGDLSASRQLTSRIAVVGATAIIFALACAAFAQTRYWRDSETLWTHALAVTRNNDFAHNNFGYLCADRGDLDEAISHFEAAAKIRSQKKDKHYNAGSAFVEMNLGDALARKGQTDEALFHYERAIQLEPNYADAYYNRGNVLFTKGRVDEAIADWERTLLIQPNDPDAHTCLGNAFLQQGSFMGAITQYQMAVALAPADPHSRNNIAWILTTCPDDSIRDGAKAVGFAQQAVALSGGREPQFLRTLAAAYAETGQFTEAIAAARQAAAIANMQGERGLATRLEKDLLLYRANLPLHAGSLGD